MPNVLGALSEQRDFRLYALQLFLLFYECSPDLDKLVDGLKGRKVQGRNQKFHLFELGTTIKCYPYGRHALGDGPLRPRPAHRCATTTNREVLPCVPVMMRRTMTE